MKQTRLLMGMPITVEVVESSVTDAVLEEIYDYFRYVDQKFSTYKEDSEISLINRGEIEPENFSKDMKTVFALSEQTKAETDGYFDIYHQEKFDPSGIVKGWAILNAANLLKTRGFKNYYVDAGGDIELSGKNPTGERWKVGIRNPFNAEEIVKVVSLSDGGVATSGTYSRGQHIYNPKTGRAEINDIASLTVIGPDVYEADRFATAAFAMGKKGIGFIERLKDFEGYLIDVQGRATFTGGFEKYVTGDD